MSGGRVFISRITEATSKTLARPKLSHGDDQLVDHEDRPRRRERAFECPAATRGARRYVALDLGVPAYFVTENGNVRAADSTDDVYEPSSRWSVVPSARPFASWFARTARVPLVTTLGVRTPNCYWT